MCCCGVVAASGETGVPAGGPVAPELWGAGVSVADIALAGIRAGGAIDC